MNKYCECKEPEWEEDDNHFKFCMICEKECEGNYYDYSPSEEPPEDYDIETNSLIL